MSLTAYYPAREDYFHTIRIRVTTLEDVIPGIMK